jgi:hypothetical protein
MKENIPAEAGKCCTKSEHSSAWMKLFATRWKRKFNNPVSFDEKRHMH